MNDSRDNLSTADLAGQTAAQTPEPTQRDGDDGPDRSEDPVRDQPESHRPDTGPDPSTGSAGVAGDMAGSAGDAAPEGPIGTDYDRDTTGPTGTGYDQDPTGLTGTGYDQDTDDSDQRSAAGGYTEGAGLDTTDDRRDVAGSGPVRTDVPPATTSTTMDTPGAGSSTVESTTGPLLGSADSEGFRARWTGVQTGFVDAPREAVQKADALVAELMQHLARTFADERGKLERQWDRGDDVPTDDLRDAFQRYRSFFERLLST